MSTSVGMKPRKKQSSLSERKAFPVSDRAFEQSLLSLETACLRILEGQFAPRRDTEGLYWQQRLKNIVTPVSLALAEYKGPRRFHYHYRHREDDESILRPVLEPTPIDMLAQVCQDALFCSRSELMGMQDETMVRLRGMLEIALAKFLRRYREYKKQLRK